MLKTESRFLGLKENPVTLWARNLLLLLPLSKLELNGIFAGYGVPIQHGGPELP